MQGRFIPNGYHASQNVVDKIVLRRDMGVRLMALLAGVLAAGLFGGCGGAAPKRSDTPAPPPLGATGLSGERALEEVASFIALGPRISGTPGALASAKHIQSRLREIGVIAEIQSFVDDTPEGEKTFHNVIARFPGRTDRIVLIGGHHDTKAGIPNFVGANDSGSSTGLLLELARIFKAQSSPHRSEIMMVFFDGEEALRNYGPRDGLHGSRHLAARMANDGSLSRLRAVVILDMIGDRDLSLTLSRDTHPGLLRLTFASAEEIGIRPLLRLYRGNILDDHVPFMQRGIPAIDLIDFAFGSAPHENDFWHTAEDTLDKLSADSLDKVGRLTIALLNRIETEALE